MMQPFRAAILAGALFGVGMMSHPAAAQDRPQGRPMMPKMLGDDDPNVGDLLPDITIYNDKGEPIALRSLKGKFKVIVFGCLT